MLAVSNMDGSFNRWFLEPVFKGSYPYDMVNLYAVQGADISFIKEDDFEIISEKCDFLGINYYNRSLVKYDAKSNNLFTGAESNYLKTDMGWDISPEEFIDLIQMVRDKYTDLPIYITENGSAWKDVAENGRVHDVERIDYLVRHLQSVAKMNQRGLNVAGYFCWSLMDNFEWAYGYSKRFGIVYVDFDTQERIKKDSYYKYKEIIETREIL
jgi:beta-glucosidase